MAAYRGNSVATRDAKRKDWQRVRLLERTRAMQRSKDARTNSEQGDVVSVPLTLSRPDTPRSMVMSTTQRHWPYHKVFEEAG